MLIYKAENKINGKSYIGQTSLSLEKRIKSHVADSNRTNCSRANNHFQSAMRKHGIASFDWIVLFECFSKDEMNEMEKFFIANYKATRELYNMTDGGDVPPNQKGKRLSEETKLKISKSLIGNTRNSGRSLSAEHREKISSRLKGRPSSNKGKKASDETRIKLSEAHKGNKSRTGMRASEEEKNKRNAAVRIACSLPEYRANMSRITKERWSDPEYRERLRLSQREAAKKRWSDPEYRMKVLTAKGYI
jgi:group I intron endonuclease